MNLSCQKSLFSLPNDIHYLNCATFGPLNKLSERAGQEALLLGKNPLLRTRDLFFEPIKESKRLFAKLVNTDQDQIAIIPSASYGLAIAAKNIPLLEGEEVLVLEDQFPSNYYIWKDKCVQANGVFKTIANPRSQSNSADWTANIISAIGEKTKIVTLAHVHWMDGTYFDLEAIGKACRKNGVYLVIDGTQSVGALPFDIDVIQPDVLIVASYKWLLSAYGLGYAYFSPLFDQGQPLEMNWINRDRSDEFERLTNYTDLYQPGAARYSMGEQSNFISIGMANEALNLLNEWTPQAIQEYTKTLTADAWDVLCAEGVQIDSTNPSYHITGLRFDDNWDMAVLQQTLKRKNIVVAQRGSALRIAVNVYNEQRDIDALVNTILENKKS